MFAMSSRAKTTRSKSRATPGTKKRRCLVCKQVFESTWIGNRVCQRCRQSTTWKQGA
jgi:hypothetical protein